jgi:hypothetical protein
MNPEDQSVMEAAGQSVMDQFPDDERKSFDPTIIITIIQTIVGLISGCKPTPAPALKAKAQEALDGTGWGFMTMIRVQTAVHRSLRANEAFRNLSWQDFADTRDKVAYSILSAAASAPPEKIEQVRQAATRA